jgi:uncharacterized membrane protein (UPF0127 family)
MAYRITNARTGEVVSDNATMASSPLRRMRGLLGRASLPGKEAIILRPGSSIHMLFMRFAIDVIYIDRNDRVVKVVRGLKPWRFSAARGAHSTIEMMTGATDGVSLEPGDQLRIEQDGASRN